MARMMRMTMNNLTPAIPDKLFFRIGEVAKLLDVKPYVLRYWETEFPMVAPVKSATGQRVYKRADVEMLFLIKNLLYVERFSIEGARKRIRDLKKEGELKTTLNEVIQEVKKELKEEASNLSQNIVSQEKLEKMKLLSSELQKLAKKPVSDIFKTSSK